MKKVVLLAFVLMLLSISMFGTRLVITVGGSTTHHVYPGQSIQDAINSAESRDTIFVHSGTYYENVVVDKPLSLIGEGKTTVIYGMENFEDVILVTADNVVVANFTVTHGGETAAGIFLRNCTNTKIQNNNIINNRRFGILLHYSSNNTFIGNNIENNAWEGIYLWVSSKNIILENSVANNLDGSGIVLFGSSNNNAISGNNITANSQCGINSDSSNDNIISGNNIANNHWGICLRLSFNNRIYHNNFIDNTIQVYIESFPMNTWDYGYPSGGNYWSNYTGVDLYRGPYQNVTGSDGIRDTPHIINEKNTDRYPLMHPWSCLPAHNINTGSGYPTIQEAIYANETLDGHTIFVDAGTYTENLIVNKTLTLIGQDKSVTIIDGNGTGTVVHVTANNVTICGFTIQNSGTMFWDGGIWLSYSDGNTITDNSIVNNKCGIILLNSGGNIIYHNSFIDNLVQASVSINITEVEASTWDDGYPSGGNYWSDYEERYPNATEIDGIWDTPYVINENNQDNYPLVVPEFPTWTSMLLILILLTVAIAIYKRRLLKTPVH